MYDSNNNNGDQLAARLEALERKEIEVDEAHYRHQKQLFNNIEQCELAAGKKVQPELLDAFKQWISWTTGKEPCKQKPNIAKKQTTMQELVNDSLPPKKVDEKPPNGLDHNDSDQCEVGTDTFIDGFDSKQLAGMIQGGRSRSTLTEDELRRNDRRRLQLASQRKGDLENTLNSTPHGADRDRLTALLQLGPVYHTLQAGMQKSDDENSPTMPPIPSTVPKNQKYSTMSSSSRNASNAMPTNQNYNSPVETRSTKNSPSSTGTSTATPGTSLSTPRKSVAAQDSSSSTAGTSSSAAHSTTFIQKFICQMELDGGICNDSACESAHFRDYEVARS